MGDTQGSGLLSEGSAWHLALRMSWAGPFAIQRNAHRTVQDVGFFIIFIFLTGNTIGEDARSAEWL